MTSEKEPQSEVDFVLVWEHSSDEEDDELFKNRRKQFEEGLEAEGLTVVRDEETDKEYVHFVRLSASDDVLKRYAEILKLKLPIKKFDLNGAHCTIDAMPGLPDVEICEKSWRQKIFSPFFFDESKFEDDGYKLTAVFSRDKEYMFDMDRPNVFSRSTRSRIVEFMLKRQRLVEDDIEIPYGIEQALSDGVYCSAYPLHDGPMNLKGCMRNTLLNEWASVRKMFKTQPLDAVKDYYGVKVALYFGWLGFYTNLLFFPAIMGVLCFLYGLISWPAHTPSQEICENEGNVTMCPACDSCDFQKLDDACFYSSIVALFDNASTVFFAVFMSIWAALFQEFWKRYSNEMAHKWDTIEYSHNEEQPRPGYLERLASIEDVTVNVVTGTKEPRVPFWTARLPGILISASTLLLMVVVVLATAFGVILYRMSMVIALSAVDETILVNSSLFIMVTAAVINFLCICAVDKVYCYLAVYLTEMELNRTQTEFDDSLVLKIYVLQFVNYYASIFYVAFVKGSFVGHPGSYNRIFGFRQEECGPGGCLMDLCIQLTVIFVGKQFFGAIVEYYWPLFCSLFQSAKTVKCDYEPSQWAADFKLAEWGNLGLFYEYLEMVIQYGFVTIFVSAFPLAPLFALINNLFELRLDAKKMLIHYRRPVAIRVKDIGIWLKVLESLGRISVVTNALIIAFTSEFIPQLVYRLEYSDDYSLNGYTNFTLSYFDPDDLEPGPMTPENELEYCAYIGFRNHPDRPDPYKLEDIYWHIFAARLIFVVVFQNLVGLTVMIIRWIVPSMSKDLKDRLLKEKFVTNEIIIRTELQNLRNETMRSRKSSTTTHL